MRLPCIPSLALIAATCATASAQDYRYVDLGTFVWTARPLTCIDQSRVVRSCTQWTSSTDRTAHITRWIDGVTSPWIDVPMSQLNQVEQVSPDGWIMGTHYDPGTGHWLAQIIHDGQVVDTPSLPRDHEPWANGTSRFTGTHRILINVSDGHDIYDASGHFVYGYGTERLFLWDNGTSTELHGPSASCTGIDLSEQGHALVEMQVGDPDAVDDAHPLVFHAGLLTPAGTTDLGEFYPARLNEHDEAVGARVSQGLVQAMLWRSGTLSVLAAPGTDAEAHGINAHGDAVGSFDDGSQHACLWRDGALIDLNAELPDPSAASHADDIIDDGTILGWTQDGSQVHRWLLIPRSLASDTTSTGTGSGTTPGSSTAATGGPQPTAGTASDGHACGLGVGGVAVVGLAWLARRRRS